MQTINLFEFSPDEISYMISRLTESQLEIVAALAGGKSDNEIAKEITLHVGALRSRIVSACDRVGVKNRAQLITLYTIYKREKDKK